MTSLSFGIGLFIVAIVIHIAVWRFRRPKNHIKALVFIFVVTLTAGLLAFKKVNPSPSSVLLFISLALAYISNYPAIEADSPSVSITLKIADAGLSGIKKEEIGAGISDDMLVLSKVRDLVSGGLISLKEGRYIVNQKGRLMARIFILSRRLMKADEIGG
ncbi:MAG: hypothetical protein AUJ75_02945 [Candidatus Omnitrophica bacterium CG1_02_49_10]|nr:MAG: hypothetical protein AUJ75_02945 [Candidatus Omnitrophica bacterium CG1_02_49_10]